MMNSRAHSRLTWWEAMRADIEAGGAAFVVIPQSSILNRRRRTSMKIRTNAKAGYGGIPGSGVKAGLIIVVV